MNLVLEKPHPTIQKHPRKATSTEIYRDFGDWCSSCWTMKTSQLETWVVFFFCLQKKTSRANLESSQKVTWPHHTFQWPPAQPWTWLVFLKDHVVLGFFKRLHECSQPGEYLSIHPSIYSYTRLYHIIFYHVSCIHVLDIKYYMLCTYIYIYTIYIYIYTIYIYIYIYMSCYILHIAYIISYYIKLYKHIIYYHIIYHVVYYDIFCYMYSIIYYVYIMMFHMEWISITCQIWLARAWQVGLEQEDVLLREGWARNETISLVAIMGASIKPQSPKGKKSTNRWMINIRWTFRQCI